MPKIFRGIAVPPFSDNPEEFADLGVEVEQAGFDGYFLWDHMVFSNSGEGPPILDPWLILAVVAARTIAAIVMFATSATVRKTFTALRSSTLSRGDLLLIGLAPIIVAQLRYCEQGALERRFRPRDRSQAIPR